jgi:peroxiredoxin
VGTLAPAFSLPDDSGGVVGLSALRGADVVAVKPARAASRFSA